MPALRLRAWMKVSVSNLLMYRPERDNDALPENAGSNVKSVKSDW